MRQRLPKSYMMRLWCNERVGIRTATNRKYRVTERVLRDHEDPNCDGRPLAILDEDENASVQVILPMVQHIDDEAFDSKVSFEEALNDLLSASFRAGRRIGMAEGKRSLIITRKRPVPDDAKPADSSSTSEV